ncbi:MAG TPA: hypothetical protein VEH29_07850 [Acidimicrobiales bacterium]|nr:hypothetical protein [Acidimicrobiales bacterium]
MGWLRRHYGAGPLHLVGVLACFAIAAYAVTRVLGQTGWKGIFLWFVACLIAHDLIGWPIYALADRALVGAERRHPGSRALVPWINHVRVPTVISGVLLAMFFPLIFRLSNAYYEGSTGFNENVYLVNWLAVSGILFGASAFIYMVRLGLAYRRKAPRSSDAPTP